jgi:hypothetical protein
MRGERSVRLQTPYPHGETTRGVAIGTPAEVVPVAIASKPSPHAAVSWKAGAVPSASANKVVPDSPKWVANVTSIAEAGFNPKPDRVRVTDPSLTLGVNVSDE